MVLFYTGTGNSGYVAKRMAEILDDEFADLFADLRLKDNVYESEKPWVIVSPTYAWRLPLILEKWFAKAEFNGSKEVYFVLTCGDSIGNAEKYARQLCEAKGMEFKGLDMVVMPENYIAMFQVPKPSTARKIIAGSEAQIEKLAGIIKKNAFFERKITFVDRILSSFINASFYKFFLKDKKFYVKDSCLSCGKCEKICPMANISMKKSADNKDIPQWKGNCTHCMACICHCLNDSIEYGKESIGKFHYTFEKTAYTKEC